jgi:hypothetical protein
MPEISRFFGIAIAMYHRDHVFLYERLKAALSARHAAE